MKKLFALLFVVAAVTLVSCGQSKEDAAKDKALEQAKMDSIFKFSSQSTAAAQDSVNAMKKDSTTAPAMEEKK